MNEDKNPFDNGGWTPLHWAANFGHLDVCRLILQNVENKHPVNNVGETPEDLVDQRKHPELFQLLKSY